MVSEKKLEGAEQKESLLASSNLDLDSDTIPAEKKELPKANKKSSKDKTNLKNKKKKGNLTETQEETEILLKEENEGSVLNESALSEKDDVTLSDFKAESPKEILKFDMNEDSALDAFLESENEDKHLKKDLFTERQELLISEDTSLHMSSSGILTPDPKNSPELSETNENEREKANRKARAPLPIQISKAALAEPKVDNGMAPGVSSSGKVHDIQEAHKGQPMGLPAEYDVTIIQAAQLGNIIAIEYLLEKNANVVNEKDSGGCSPLHWAAINNRIEAARFLLKNGAEVDAQGGDLKATPLHWACRQGLLDMMVVLLEYGADPTLKDSQGFNIVHLSIHSFNFMSLIYALSLPGLPVDIADGQGHTPLMWAAYQGFSQAVELLLKFGADINARDCTSYTPLHWGVVKGDEGIIQKLIMARADLMAVDGQGQTPSDVAVVSKTETAWLAALRATGYDPADLSKPTKRWTTEQVKRAALILPAPVMSTVMLTLVNFPWEMALPMVIMQMWLFYHFGIKKLLNRCSPALCLQESPYHVGIFLTTVAFTFLTYLWSIAPATFNAHPWQNMLFSSLFATSLYFYWLTTTGDPGFLPSNLSLSDHKELLQKLVQDGRLTVRHFCTSCLAQRPIRSKHCRFCNRCVARFDHHCPWNYNCIGASNHRDFVIFTVSLALGILMFEHLGLAYLDLQSAEYAVMELPCILSENICSYFQQEPFLTFTLGWNALQLFWLSMVVVYQLYLIARSTTTNESINHDKYSYFVSSPEQTTPTEPNAINRLASYIHLRAGNVSPRRQFRNPFDRGVVANCLSFWLQRPTPSYWSQIYDTPTEILDVGNPYASVPLNDLGSINDTNRHDDSELVEDGFLDSSLFPSSRADVVSNSRH